MGRSRGERAIRLEAKVTVIMRLLESGKDYLTSEIDSTNSFRLVKADLAYLQKHIINTMKLDFLV